MPYNPKERLDYLDDRCYPSSKWTLDEHDALRHWKLEKDRADKLQKELDKRILTILKKKLSKFNKFFKKNIKKEVSNYEKLKIEIIKEAQEKIEKLSQNKKCFENLSKRMFEEPNHSGWIHNYGISNSVFCYFIMRDLLNEDIIEPFTKNKKIQWFGHLKKRLETYKELHGDDKYYHPHVENPISETYIENGGYIYCAFLNTHKDCIKYIMIPFLEYIIKELHEKGCFHVRANIYIEGDVNPI